MKRLLMWIVCYIPLGRLAPWVFGIAIRKKPRWYGWSKEGCRKTRRQ